MDRDRRARARVSTVDQLTTAATDSAAAVASRFNASPLAPRSGLG